MHWIMVQPIFKKYRYPVASEADNCLEGGELYRQGQNDEFFKGCGNCPGRGHPSHTARGIGKCSKLLHQGLRQSPRS